MFWLLKNHLREKFVVTLDTGDAMAGLLLDADKHTIHLANAEYYAKGAQAPLPVDGEVYVERTRVLYLQRV